MNKKTITALLVAALAIIAVILVLQSPEEKTIETPGNWVGINGTWDIYFDKDSLRQEGSMVYVSLNNRSVHALQSLEARELLFSVAFYCNRANVRILSKTIYYNNGSIEHNEENALETNPGTDALNETPDLMDINSTPALTLAYSMFCK